MNKALEEPKFFLAISEAHINESFVESIWRYDIYDVRTCRMLCTLLLSVVSEYETTSGYEPRPRDATRRDNL